MAALGLASYASSPLQRRQHHDATSTIRSVSGRRHGVNVAGIYAPRPERASSRSTMKQPDLRRWGSCWQSVRIYAVTTVPGPLQCSTSIPISAAANSASLPKRRHRERELHRERHGKHQRNLCQQHDGCCGHVTSTGAGNISGGSVGALTSLAAAGARRHEQREDHVSGTYGIHAVNTGNGSVTVINTGAIDPPLIGIYAQSLGRATYGVENLSTTVSSRQCDHYHVQCRGPSVTR